MTFEIEELEQQNQPIALSTAVGVGALAVGSFSAGYMVGSDMAN